MQAILGNPRYNKENVLWKDKLERYLNNWVLDLHQHLDVKSPLPYGAENDDL